MRNCLNRQSTAIVHPAECPYCLTPLSSSPTTATSPSLDPPTPSPLPAHLLTCDLVPVPCPFAPYGCPTRLSRAQLQLSHLAPPPDQACALQPLAPLLVQFDTLQDENRALRARCEALEEGMAEMRRMMKGVKRGMGEWWGGAEAAGANEAQGGGQERGPAVAEVVAPSQSPSLPHTGRPAFPPFASSTSSIPSPQQTSPAHTPLPTLLSSHSAHLATLDASLSALDARHTQARTDATHAVRAEIHDLRQGLLAVRAQVMHLHVDQARRDAMQRGGVWGSPFRGVGGRIGGDEGEEGGSGSGSDDEMGGMARGYRGGMGMGMGMMRDVGMMDPGTMGMGVGMSGSGPRFGMFPLGMAGRPMYSPPGMGGGIKL